MGAACRRCCCCCCKKNDKTDPSAAKRPTNAKELHEFKVSALAALHSIDGHKENVVKMLQRRDEHNDFDTEKHALCEHTRQKYERDTLKPLENEFNSGYWKPNARRAKLKYDSLMKTSNSVSKKGMQRFQDVAMIVESYKQIHRELEQSLQEERAQAEDEERIATRRVNNMKRAVEDAEADNWNRKEFRPEEFELKIPKGRIAQYVA